MKKRIISIILAISFLFSLVPAVRAEEKAAQTGSIEEQIRAYADSIDQNGAESTAAMTLATHGITGGEMYAGGCYREWKNEIVYKFL